MAARKSKTAEKRENPRGPRLNAAAAAARNTLMATRKAQGWTWEAIAGEAGISVAAAKGAVKRHLEAQPLRLATDPVQVIQHVFEGYQMSIGDFEAIGAAAIDKNQLAVAVGAKKGANEARDKIILLLQATNRMPQELGALRHLIDLRAVAVRMLDAMDSFQREMDLVARLESEEERRAGAVEATRKVRTVFNELMGVEQPALEGSVSE